LKNDQSTLLMTGLNDQWSVAQASATYTTGEQALSAAGASFTSAQAAVSRAQRYVDVVTQVDAQRIQSQKDNLKDDRLTAPISGKVKSVELKPGMEVSSAPSELTLARNHRVQRT
jgi:multidrug efflux pump subunit AcrA (membrane-fusion protein)